MVREEHRGLACRVPGPDDVDVEAVDVRRLAASRAVKDPLAAEAVESLDRQTPPRDTAGEDDRLRAQKVTAVEVDVTVLRVDPRDRAGDEDLRAEATRLLQRPARELLTRHAGGESEVVLDPGRRAGLAARGLTLDDDRAQSLRCAVDGRCKTSRPGADDDRVVLGCGRLRLEPQQLGDPSMLRLHHRLPADDADCR